MKSNFRTYVRGRTKNAIERRLTNQLVQQSENPYIEKSKNPPNFKPLSTLKPYHKAETEITAKIVLVVLLLGLVFFTILTR